MGWVFMCVGKEWKEGRKSERRAEQSRKREKGRAQLMISNKPNEPAGHVEWANSPTI